MLFTLNTLICGYFCQRIQHVVLSAASLVLCCNDSWWTELLLSFSVFGKSCLEYICVLFYQMQVISHNLKRISIFCTRTITVLFFVYLNKQYFCILRFGYFLFCACLSFFFLWEWGGCVVLLNEHVCIYACNFAVYIKALTLSVVLYPPCQEENCQDFSLSCTAWRSLLHIDGRW